MSLMLKLLTIIAIVSTSIFAGGIEENIVEYFEAQVERNPSIELTSVEVVGKKPLEGFEGWSSYFVKMKIIPKKMPQATEIMINELAFSNGKMIAPDFYDMNKNKSIKRFIYPNVTKKYYNKAHLIYGNADAKHKILAFSDPRCPFCMDLLPDVMKIVKENPTKAALYYYDYPLEAMHPRSIVLSKLGYLAKKQGLKDVNLNIYEADFDNTKPDPESMLKAFNKIFSTKITLAELTAKEVQTHYDEEKKMGNEMMVRGTPTIFVDGQKSANPIVAVRNLIK